MTFIRAVVFAALFLFSVWGTAHAQDVTLKSPDGQVALSGTLLGFDGEFYRLDTVYGEMTIDGSGVRCEGPACPNLQEFVAEISISGSATMGAVLMPALIEGFGLRNGFRTERVPEEPTRFTYQLYNETTNKLVAEFQLRVTNTDEGFADLLANEADIVMALREIRASERQRARDAGMGDLTGPNRSRVLALDAIVPIVSPGNPVRSISPPQLAAIFAGEIVNWSDLGGPNAPIDLHLPSGQTGLGQAVADQVMKPAKLKFGPNIVRHVSGVDLALAVAASPFAIGIASYAETGNTLVLTLRGECGFALRAARRTIKTEDYPLTAPMFLYLPARRLPKVAREFLAYTRGQSAQNVVRRAGFVDQAAEEISISNQGSRFANAITTAGTEISLKELQRMISKLDGMARLTTSFRFETGSIRLDAQSRSNVQQLARALEIGKYDARRLMFVGFSDGDGPAQANRDIALRRAEAVRRAVSKAAETVNPDRVKLDVDAFGEALPMACDDSAWGRQANRRVEVWLR